jgi:hypothetical protein
MHIFSTYPLIVGFDFAVPLVGLQVLSHRLCLVHSQFFWVKQQSQVVIQPRVRWLSCRVADVVPVHLFLEEFAHLY